MIRTGNKMDEKQSKKVLTFRVSEAKRSAQLGTVRRPERGKRETVGGPRGDQFAYEEEAKQEQRLIKGGKKGGEAGDVS